MNSTSSKTARSSGVSQENSSIKRNEVDIMIADMTSRLGRHMSSMYQFLSEMTKFSEFQSQIDRATESIASLGTSCREIEDQLVLLEDMCDEMAHNNSKFDHQYQLRKYHERKHLELEQVKANMAKEHATRVQRYERQLCAQLRERQKVFEAAFVEQMKSYKASGRVPDPDESSAPAETSVTEMTEDSFFDSPQSAAEDETLDNS